MSRKSNRSTDKPQYVRVGELARAVGKTVRALHLYEELGLVEPTARTEGGFRLYGADAVARISWITKLQAIGFTLSEIQGFVDEFEGSSSGREASNHARQVFATKLDETRNQIHRLEGIENDLREALAYLDGCSECSRGMGPVECRQCDLSGHEPDSVPTLFAGLSRSASNPSAADRLGKAQEGEP